MLTEQLSEELQEQAKNELNEIPNEIESNLQDIRDWVKKQPYSNIARIGCKFRLKNTKEKLDYFHKVRYTYPSIFTDRDPLSADIQNFLNSGIMLVVQDKTHINIILNWKNADPNKISLELIFKAGLMMLEIFINENNFCMITGFHVVIDYSNFSFKYIPQVHFILVRKVLYILQNAYPLRLRGIHFINVPRYLEVFLNVVKPLLQKHIKKFSIYRENNTELIFKFIPKEIVPVEFGGEGLDVNTITEKFKTKMNSYRDWFIEDEQRFVKNRMTPNKDKSNQDVSNGFSKLSID